MDSTAMIVVIVLLFPGLGFLFLIVAGLAVHHRQMSKVHRDGICDRCNYDLTGNTSNVCPECGLRIMSSRAVM
jgi:Na+-transporting methylmalonyl-CoA/oxaloacetate decarboxylase gamma subunit